MVFAEILSITWSVSSVFTIYLNHNSLVFNYLPFLSASFLFSLVPVLGEVTAAVCRVGTVSGGAIKKIQSYQ